MSASKSYLYGMYLQSGIMTCPVALYRGASGPVQALVLVSHFSMAIITKQLSPLVSFRKQLLPDPTLILLLLLYVFLSLSDLVRRHNFNAFGGNLYHVCTPN